MDLSVTSMSMETKQSDDLDEEWRTGEIRDSPKSPPYEKLVEDDEGYDELEGRITDPVMIQMHSPYSRLPRRGE